MTARRLLLAAALMALPARAAMAQTPGPPPPPAQARFHVAIDVGAQAKAGSFSDAFDVPLYQENQHTTVDYPDVGGLFVSGAVRYQIWKQMTVGVGVSTFTDTGDASITSDVPHPFFDNRFRTVQGTASTKRDELNVYPTVGWLVPVSPSVQIGINGGPSILNVKQQFVTGVKFAETYPFDTASFTSADLTQASHTAVGIYVGADVTWMFSKNVGAGGTVQFSRATVKEKVGDRTISLDAGGAQYGGGIRFRF